jgi:hypothetical protein
VDQDLYPNILPGTAPPRCIVLVNGSPLGLPNTQPRCLSVLSFGLVNRHIGCALQFEHDVILDAYRINTKMLPIRFRWEFTTTVQSNPTIRCWVAHRHCPCSPMWDLLASKKSKLYQSLIERVYLVHFPSGLLLLCCCIVRSIRASMVRMIYSKNMPNSTWTAYRQK